MLFQMSLVLVWQMVPIHKTKYYSNFSNEFEYIRVFVDFLHHHLEIQDPVFQYHVDCSFHLIEIDFIFNFQMFNMNLL